METGIRNSSANRKTHWGAPSCDCVGPSCCNLWPVSNSHTSWSSRCTKQNKATRWKIHKKQPSRETSMAVREQHCSPGLSHYCASFCYSCKIFFRSSTSGLLRLLIMASCERHTTKLGCFFTWTHIRVKELKVLYQDILHIWIILRNSLFFLTITTGAWGQEA